MIGRIWELGREVAERAVVARTSGVLASGDATGLAPPPVPTEVAIEPPMPTVDPSTAWIHRVVALGRAGELADAEAVRRARVAARKLRTGLAGLEPVDTASVDALRELGKRLGRIRDRDVALRVLAELPRTDALVDAVLDEQVDRERRRRREAMQRTTRWLGRHDVAELGQRIAAALAATPSVVRRAALARADDELRATLRDAIDRLRTDELEPLHAVRVMAKRLRHLQLWSGGSPDARALVRAARQVQSAIGGHRDVALVHERLLRRRQRAQRRGRIAAVRGLDRILTELADRRRAELASIAPALTELRRALG